MKIEIVQLLFVLPTLLLCQCASQKKATLAAPSPQVRESLSKQSLNAAILSEVNRYRAQNGKPALRSSSRLNALASEHSSAMARTGDVDHRDFLNRVFVARSANIRVVAENVGRRPRPTTGTSFATGWSDSKAHRRNMLRDATTAGVGTSSANGQTYATFLVGSQ